MEFVSHVDPYSAIHGPSTASKRSAARAGARGATMSLGSSSASVTQHLSLNFEIA